MSERFYMLRECIILSFFPEQHSFHSQQRTHRSQPFSVFVRICVPGGFMLATVLGCVCLGIASIIYLVVRFWVFWGFFLNHDLKENGLNVVSGALNSG